MNTAPKTSLRLITSALALVLAVAGLLIATQPVLAGPPDMTDTVADRAAQIQSELAAALAEIEASMTLVERGTGA